VYGPRQRPDLAIHRIADRITAGRPVEVFGDGSSARDYTFIQDAVDAIAAATHWRNSGFEIVNVGSGRPIPVTTMIRGLEDVLGLPANIVHLPAHPCDVPLTHADLRHASRVLGYRPAHAFETGLQMFAEWLRVHRKWAA
jgi:UDP-glucuronate 4-epimerase